MKMQNIPARFKNYVSLAAIGSAGIIAAQAVAAVFGYEITEDFAKSFLIAFNAVLFFLVSLGVINDPTQGKGLGDGEGEDL